MAAMDENQCLKWLNLWEVGSFVYACLGTLCTLIPSQMLELGLGLEASNRPFIWVTREWQSLEELDRRMKEDGYENRIKGFKDGHPKFQYCVTLLSEEQFFNEKFIVQVLQVSIRIGAEVLMKRGEEDNFGVLVKKGDVRKPVELMIDESEEARDRKRSKRGSENGKES
ncbi:UDP-glycosyltransferase [Ancistrocladus abbreviatus]